MCLRRLLSSITNPTVPFAACALSSNLSQDPINHGRPSGKTLLKMRKSPFTGKISGGIFEAIGRCCPMSAKILLVDDEASILSVLKTLLSVEGYTVTTIQNGEQAVEILKSEEFDLMLSDIRMAPVSGMELLRLAHDNAPAMAVIMMTAFGSIETAVEALKMGAYDYVTKPFKIDELLITIERALEYKRALSENIDLKAQVGALFRFESIVAESSAMRNVCQMVEHVAMTDATVLICGESGTGRSLIAGTIHRQSGRKDKKFVPINCGALPENLLESELFGCAPGALPGESAGKEGAFETAVGGTVFLADIGALPMGVQEKLMRVLTDRSVTRMGGKRATEIDVRVLASTNVNLERLIQEGTFRPDLFARINVIPIEMKPLRDRKEDILPLVYHILLRELGSEQELPSLEPRVREVLMRYGWPGNIRQLESALKHAVSVMKETTITVDNLPADIVSTTSTEPRAGGAGMTDEYRGKSLKLFLRSKEKEYVEQMLKHAKGDKVKAAKALDISLATLYRKLPVKESKGDTPPAKE